MSPRRAGSRRGTRGALVGLALVAAAAVTIAACDSSSGKRSEPPVASSSTASSAPATTSSTAATTTTVAPSTTTTVALPPSDTTRMRVAHSIGGAISPKSVVASGHGIVFAQNMMYRHTMTVYSSTGNLIRTIPDSVDLSAFGIAGHPGITHGAPVEAAFTPDGHDVYVSNYSMYGAGFGPEGTDSCTPASGYNDDYLYRVDVKRLAIDQVIRVGPVPKYVAVTPDGRDVLVSNWCGFNLSVVDTKTGKEIQRIPLGPHPRGIAVTPDSRTAYVAVMGTSNIAVVDLHTFAVSWINGVGSNPRHVVISPSGRYLYATLNGAGRIAKIDLTTRTVVGRATTGSEPRSMAISPDGTALYVVNYGSDTVTKVRASDLSVLQTIGTPHHPIGITYDRSTHDVWVSCYEGHILVFADG